MRGLVAAAFCFALAGCAAPPSGDGTSGIAGVVLVGPTCPVERDPPDPNCADRPYAGHFAVTKSDGGAPVAEFWSAANGTFRVAVAPGSYILRDFEPDGTPPTCGPTEPIVVQTGRYTDATVSCDSGIR